MFLLPQPEIFPEVISAPLPLDLKLDLGDGRKEMSEGHRIRDVPTVTDSIFIHQEEQSREFSFPSNYGKIWEILVKFHPFGKYTEVNGEEKCGGMVDF